MDMKWRTKQPKTKLKNHILLLFRLLYDCLRIYTSKNSGGILLLLRIYFKLKIFRYFSHSLYSHPYAICSPLFSPYPYYFIYLTLKTDTNRMKSSNTEQQRNINGYIARISTRERIVENDDKIEKNEEFLVWNIFKFYFRFKIFFLSLCVCMSSIFNNGNIFNFNFWSREKKIEWDNKIYVTY